MASRASSKVSTDHDEIRQWAEERGAKPACVRGTGDKGDIGMLRLDFPGYSGAQSLVEISWDDWFQKFDERGLALLHQEQNARGQKSNFNKIIARETAQARAEGDTKASVHRGRTRASSRGASSRRQTSARASSSRSASGRTRSASTRGKASSTRRTSAKGKSRNASTSRTRSASSRSRTTSARGKSTRGTATSRSRTNARGQSRSASTRSATNRGKKAGNTRSVSSRSRSNAGSRRKTSTRAQSRRGNNKVIQMSSRRGKRSGSSRKAA